jgi:hypothetical protein
MSKFDFNPQDDDLQIQGAAGNTPATPEDIADAYEGMDQAREMMQNMQNFGTIDAPSAQQKAEAAQLLLGCPEFQQIGSFPVARATETLQAITGEPVQGDALGCVRSALRTLVESADLAAQS